MRLIDADAMPSVKFHALPYTHITPSDVNAESYKRGWNDAIDAIVDCAPTIDAVPVVRCWECKYCTEHYDTDGNVPYWTCSEWDSGTDADGFCHYGEREDGADNG